jgi:maleylpyruvate isomerase
VLKLYSYFRSSAAYRVRIALNLKSLPYEILPVHLLRNGGEQKQAEYARLNPAQLVPTLVDGNLGLTQSLAILEYLDEAYPSTPPLLPADAASRARVRALALTVACEMHPINNLRVLKYLKNSLGVPDAERDAWYRHWASSGFDVLEQLLGGHSGTGKYCHGDSITMADCCLIPQVFNARRFNMPMDGYPTIVRIESACLALDAFQKAAPGIQPDAE